MKYLDEQIIATANNSTTGATTGMYQYRVQVKVDGFSGVYSTIFVGNLYHNVGETISVDITDICRNHIWLPTEKDLYDSADGTGKNIKLVNTYRVLFYTDSQNYITGDDIQVAKVYRYPHKLGYMSKNVFFDYTVNNNVSFPLQGRYNQGGKGYYHLVPRYPYISTNNYRIILASESSLNISNVTGHLTGAVKGDYTIQLKSPSSYITYELANLFSGTTGYTECNFQTAEQNIGDFHIDVHSTSIDVNEEVQTSGFYCKLIETNNSGLITKNLTEWIPTNTNYSIDVTIDNQFISANTNEYLILLFSQIQSTDREIYEFDYVTLQFTGITNDYIGKTMVLQLFTNEVSHGQWEIANPRLYYSLKEKTMLEVAGDYVAQIDTDCYSRYYLQWQDRMGNFQSQPFNEHYTYSENFNSETATSYTGNKRPSNIEITSKFKVNTDWIKEDLYPYYESIFTSPVLFLYDTHEDKRYTVIVTDSEYTEKTYDNQKKLFNLTLNLEINKKQTILY